MSDDFTEPKMIIDQKRDMRGERAMVSPPEKMAMTQVAMSNDSSEPKMIIDEKMELEGKGKIFEEPDEFSLSFSASKNMIDKSDASLTSNKSEKLSNAPVAPEKTESGESETENPSETDLGSGSDSDGVEEKGMTVVEAETENETETENESYSEGYSDLEIDIDMSDVRPFDFLSLLGDMFIFGDDSADFSGFAISRGPDTAGGMGTTGTRCGGVLRGSIDSNIAAATTIADDEGFFSPPFANSRVFVNGGAGDDDADVYAYDDADTYAYDDADFAGSSNGMQIGTLIFATPPQQPQYVYNVPDGASADPDFIRAESQFMNTPISEEYSGAVYYYLKNVEAYCAADYEKFCADDDYAVQGLSQVLLSMFGPSAGYGYARRKLSVEQAWKSKSGKQLLTNLRSFMRIGGGGSSKQHKSTVSALLSRLPFFSSRPKHEEAGAATKQLGAIGTSNTVTPTHGAHLAMEGGVSRATKLTPGPIIIPPSHIPGSREMDQKLPSDRAPHRQASSAANANDNNSNNKMHGRKASFATQDLPTDEEETPIFLPPADFPVESEEARAAAAAAETKKMMMEKREMKLKLRAGKTPDAHSSSKASRRLHGHHDFHLSSGGGSGPDHHHGWTADNSDSESGSGSGSGGFWHGLKSIFHGDQHHDPESSGSASATGSDSSESGSGSGSGEGDWWGAGAAPQGRGVYGGPPPPHGNWFAPPPPPPPLPPVPKDTYYSGALGFGAEGDMCLYTHARVLSPGCVQAVGNLHALREQYWQDTQEASQPPPPSPHHHFPLFLLFLFFAVVAFFGYKRRAVLRQKARNANAFLRAISLNSELKAAVETETGMKVPEPIEPSPCCRHGAGGVRRGAGNNAGSCPMVSCFARVCKAIVYFAAILFVSVHIAISSLEITGCIVNHLDMDTASQEGAEATQTTAFAALLILFAVCTIEVSLFLLLVKFVRMLYLQYAASSSSSSAEDSGAAPPSPSAPPAAYPATAQSAVGNSSTFSLSPITSFFRGNANGNGGSALYVPLMDQDLQHSYESSAHAAPAAGRGTEMVSVVPRPPSAPQQTVYVPMQVTANPVTSVNFV